MDNPLNPDKTAAGIVIDPATLDRVVPSSKRKDGTVRKELKIRPGFTPQEDVGRFRSSRQAALAAPTYIPGTTRLRASPSKPENPFAQPKPQTKPKSQAKNEKRREKRALAKLSEKLWDDEDEDDVGTGGLREDFEEVDRERAAASEEVAKVEDPPENEESHVVGDEITNGQISSGPSQESDDKEKQDVGAVSSAGIVTKNLSDDESGASRRMAELELFDIPSDGFQPTDSRIAHESSTTTASESESRLPSSSQNLDASIPKQSTSHVDPGNAKSTMANNDTLKEQHHPNKSSRSQNTRGRAVPEIQTFSSRPNQTTGAISQQTKQSGRNCPTGSQQAQSNKKGPPGSSQSNQPPRKGPPGSRPSKPDNRPESKKDGGTEGNGKGRETPPSQRVRKEVRVREGGANDVSSLAERVRGLVLSTTQPREKRGVGSKTEGGKDP